MRDQTPVKTIVAALAVACAWAAPTDASRAPTTKEKPQIEFAVRFFPTVGRQNTVQFTQVRVSTVDSRYAEARVAVRDPGGKWIAGLTALLRHASGWQVVFLGDTPPPCAAPPAKVRFDLLGTFSCHTGG